MCVMIRNWKLRITDSLVRCMRQIIILDLEAEFKKRKCVAMKKALIVIELHLVFDMGSTDNINRMWEFSSLYFT